MSYNALIEDIVSSQQSILGDAAIRIAQQVDGVTVSDGGTVEEVSGDGVTVVDALVSAYVDELGAAATGILQSTAEEYAGDLALPDSLE